MPESRRRLHVERHGQLRASSALNSCSQNWIDMLRRWRVRCKERLALLFAACLGSTPAGSLEDWCSEILLIGSYTIIWRWYK